MTTIRDVSARAGVSVATVSRVMHTPHVVSEETRQQVEKAIQETGYQPNLIARSFRTKRTFLILVLVPDIANPFFSRIIKGIEKTASEYGYSVLLGDSALSPERENAYAELVATKRADGLIQFSSRIPKPVERLVLENALPFVNACEVIPAFKGARVAIDDKESTAEMTRHLLSLGHRRIGVISGLKSSPQTLARLAGFKSTMKAHPKPVKTSFIIEGRETMESGYKAVAGFKRAELPDAIFCLNDEMAIGVMKRLSEIGLRIPRDISVAGFDDIEIGRFSTPTLTTISQPMEAIGQAAMKTLFAMIESRPIEQPLTVLPTQLIVRESTGPAPE